MSDAHRAWKEIVCALAVGLAGCSPAPTAAELTRSEARGAMHEHLEFLRPGPEPQRLVSCAWRPAETAKAVIGEEGGRLAVRGHEVIIPAGAVASPTLFIVTSPEGAHLMLHLDAQGEHGVALSRPAVVRLSYAGCERQDLARRTLAVVEIADTLTTMSTAVAASEIQSTDDSSSGSLEFVVRRLGTYAVAY